MKVYLNKISGYAGAITCMYHSKRTWTRELEQKIYDLEAFCTDYRGKLIYSEEIPDGALQEFHDLLKKVGKIGKKHITLLRFIDVEFTVEGLHRGAQDDFDAHAKRLDNRIVRSSTRLSEFSNEKSKYYQDKILTTDEALKVLFKVLPDRINANGYAYVRTTNGYIREDLKDDKDVKRGLYMLSIPSNFTAKVNITELAHIVKLRDKDSNANPELKEMVESLLNQIKDFCPLFSRDLFYEIAN